MKRLLVIFFLIASSSHGYIIGDTTKKNDTLSALNLENVLHFGIFTAGNTGMPETMYVRVCVQSYGAGADDSVELRAAIYDTLWNLRDTSIEVKAPLTEDKNDSILMALPMVNPYDSLLRAGQRYFLTAWGKQYPKTSIYIFMTTPSSGDSLWRAYEPYSHGWPAVPTGPSLFGFGDDILHLYCVYSEIPGDTVSTIPVRQGPTLPSYVHSVFGGSQAGPKPCNVIECWWDYAWAYRRAIGCDTLHSEYNGNHFMSLIDVNTTGDKFMDNGNDIRILYQSITGPKELPRYLIDVNSANTDIYFPINNIIPSNENMGVQEDYRYYMYYGNSGAGSPDAYINTACIQAPYSSDNYTSALYHFEETTSDYLDETSNNNDLDSVSVTSRTGTGKFGYAPDFTYASSERLSAPDDNTLDADSTDDICLEAWISADTDYDTDDATDRMPIVGKNIAGTDTNYKLYLSALGKITFSYYSTEWNTWTGTSVIGSVGWHHVAVCYTGQWGDSIAVYLDGETYAGSWTAADGDSTLQFNTERLGIGGE